MQTKSFSEMKYGADPDPNHEHEWQVHKDLQDGIKMGKNHSPPQRLCFVCHCGKYKIRDMEEVEK